MNKAALILLLALGLLPLAAQAQAAAPGLAELADSLLLAPVKLDSLYYTADSISYHYADEKIRLYGNSAVRYQDFDISSDSLLIDLKAEQAYSYGNTVMKDGDQILLGADVAYDMDSQSGIVTSGVSRLENGFYSGIEVRKTGRDIYDVDNGSYTTCEHKDPDFWFAAKQLRIYRGDKIVGKPVLAYVNHFPVFYFPFMTLSIRRGRHPGLLVPEPGYNTTDGKFLRDIAWYYPYKDYADLIFSLDLTERSGWEARFRTDYARRYLLSGSLDASYRKGINAYQSYADWSLRANHHQELGEKSTFDVNLDFVSSKRVWESSTDLDESLAQRVTSSVSYRKPLLSSYLNLGLVYTEDLINDNVSLSLPSATFSMPTRPVHELFYNPERSPDAWWSNLNYSYSVRLDHTGSSRDPQRDWQDLIWDNDPDPLNPLNPLTQHNLGLKHRLGLSYNWKLKGWLNLQQGLNYNEAWFDRDKNDQRFVRGNDYSAYANTNFNIYGIRNFSRGWLKSLRHIMTPSAGITYNPDFGRNSRYFSFGGIGLSSSAEAANLNLGLTHKWQLKYGKDNRKINDIITLSSRTAANLMKGKDRLGNLAHAVTFNPGSFKLGNLSFKGSTLNLTGLSLGYTSQYSFVQDPDKLAEGNFSAQNQYFSHSLALSGSAPYATYFQREKNQIFTPYEERDSLLADGDEPAGRESSDSWRVALSQDISADKDILDPRSSNLRFDAALKLTANWSLAYGNYFNLKDSELISQNLNLSRELHCWKLEVSYSRRNEYWEYRISLFNTALPDALKFQTRDSKRY